MFEKIKKKQIDIDILRKINALKSAYEESKNSKDITAKERITIKEQIDEFEKLLD